MSYRRKTCECCGVRLSAAEDYWCDDCRSRIAVHYHTARSQLEGMTVAGLTPEEAVRKLLDDVMRGRTQ